MNKNLEKVILLGHGSGGKLSHDLIRDIFVKYFSNKILSEQTDSACLPGAGEGIAFTTDSYVVDPIFFPGGNIGKLAVCGTVNDLAVSGAKPQYLSASFIIEEGFSITDLEKIVCTMAEESRKAGVKIVTGDTKVVNKGKCDKLFINTSGVGYLPRKNHLISTGQKVRPGDKIIVSGSVGDHGVAILSARENMSFSVNLKSDCASLNKMIHSALSISSGIHFMRDATRGGLATVLCELSETRGLGIEVDEENIPVKSSVQSACEIFGYEPLYMANEGKILMVVSSLDVDKVLDKLQHNIFGKKASVIGEITEKHPGKVILKTAIGGTRIVDMLTGEQLPRIC